MNAPLLPAGSTIARRRRKYRKLHERSLSASDLNNATEMHLSIMQVSCHNVGQSLTVISESSERQWLTSAGLRCTAASRALLALFEREGDAMLTHAELDRAMRACGVKISKVTLYRLLARFVATGLLRRVVYQDRVARYGREAAGTGDARVHPHFECRKCHRLYQLGNLPKALHEAMRQAIVRWEAQGHRGIEANLAVQGVCARCVAH